MKLQQLRYACEVARRGLNVSAAAEALHTSQPGISKQIKSLEDELGIEIFVRHGKRIVAVTEPGKAVMAIAERMLAEARQPEARRRGVRQREARHADHRHHAHAGALRAAQGGGGVQAALPEGASWCIHQGNPTQICEMVLAGEADLGVATEIDRRVPRAGLAALLPVEPLRGGAAEAPAAEGEAAHAGGDRAVPDRDLRLRLRQPLAGQQGVRDSAASRRTWC